MKATYNFTGECSVLKKIILWMEKIHYPITIRSHLVTIVAMAPFTPKSTSKLRSALHFSYSIVIRRFISRASFPALILLTPNNHYNHARAYLRGEGSGGSNPPEIFRFFLKSEGKEIERKR